MKFSLHFSDSTVHNKTQTLNYLI